MNAMIDQIAAEQVELLLDESGKLWVNVDGICVLRIGKVATLKIDTPALTLYGTNIGGQELWSYQTKITENKKV